MVRNLQVLLLLASLACYSNVQAGNTSVVSSDSDTVSSDGQRSSHWSFNMPQRPALPDVRHLAWVRNPVDQFVLAALEQRGWSPAPRAVSHHLLRRMYLDLIGLPPGLAEQQHVADDDSPLVFDQLVAQLLASPGYGERWGRHWLDLVRYGDTNGYEKDFLKPLVYKYRDYVIESFNKDKPYDRFILEQLAGDEIPFGNTESVIATGYYRVGPWDAERGANIFKKERDEERAAQLDDMVKTTGQVFLGLTLGCARCHDHKYDPITAHDYYSLVSIFNPLQRARKGREPLTLSAATPAQLRAKENVEQRVAELERELQELRSTHAQLAAGANGGATADLQQIPLRCKAIERELRWLHEDVAAVDEFPQGYFMHEKSPVAPPTYLLVRGSIHSPGDEVHPAVPVALVDRQPDFLEPDEFTSRRRLSLARWIADENNPLTARVIVNRVWQYHFGGQALVRSPSDFGVQGEVPSHPEMLDWLACWFVEEGNWSLKRLHQLIMTSNTYRMSQQGEPDVAQQDEENRWLARFPRRRLDIEVIRDSILAVSRQLNHKKYGPAMYPFLSEADRQGHFRPEQELKDWDNQFDEVEASRRTVYAFIQRSLVLPLLEAMDFCDTTQSVDQRSVTTVAPQALMLLNGEFVNRQARYLATRLQRDAGNDTNEQIDLAYRLALARSPTAAEKLDIASFLAEDVQRQLHEAAERGESIGQETVDSQALVQFCRLLFNLNEFVYAD